MFDRLFNDVALRAKSRTGASEEVALWIFVGVVLAITAFVFLSLAAYAWLVTIYSSAVAWLIVGAAHLLILGAVAARCASVRRYNRMMAQAKLELATKRQEQSSWKLEPTYLAVGLEVVKIVGMRNLIPIVVGGLAAVGAGWVNSRSSHKSSAPPRP